MPRKIARRITKDYLHNAALFYLERYAASSSRLRQVLLRKIKRSCYDHPDQMESDLIPMVEEELKTLTRVQLLDDDRLAAALIDGWRARGLAARMIQKKLQAKGFSNLHNLSALTPPSETLEATSNDPGTHTANEIEAATRYLKRRRLGLYARIDQNDRQAIIKNKQKSWAALARQGYDPDVIEAAMTRPIFTSEND